MKRNPIVPYILIMVMGLVLVFFLGIKGIGDAKEIAKEAEGGGEEVAAEFNPEAASKTCIGCHGENLEGAGGAPSLHGTGLSKEEIADILTNGKGMMPKGLIPAENVDEMAEWVSNLK
ncbi:cytochrome c550 [Lederbergia wuyishanensis]|uniref:Cytochrome c550 n=1 Tax=Lederbergia wuyishanensis TaxID=1347903 RepID=A0ABU0D1I3_9BACI|nr:cytochrome c [Lederbergia wuyishanensis]MCJ8006854.1 cytochrome c [Lederbergia wuyishanensis]MDQ0342238.1 cytochrome c550 [Lederbergia wuyishanensis]